MREIQCVKFIERADLRLTDCAIHFAISCVYKGRYSPFSAYPILPVVLPSFLQVRQFPRARKRTCWTSRLDFDEIMTSGLCAVCSHRQRGKDAVAYGRMLRCAMMLPPPPPREFSVSSLCPPPSPPSPPRCSRARYSLSVRNCAVLSAPFILNTSCGMNAATVSRRRNASLGIKGFVLLPRRAERGTRRERDLNSVVVVSSRNGRIAKLSESRGR